MWAAFLRLAFTVPRQTLRSFANEFSYCTVKVIGVVCVVTLAPFALMV